MPRPAPDTITALPSNAAPSAILPPLAARIRAASSFDNARTLTSAKEAVNQMKRYFIQQNQYDRDKRSSQEIVRRDAHAPRAKLKRRGTEMTTAHAFTEEHAPLRETARRFIEKEIALHHAARFLILACTEATASCGTIRSRALMPMPEYTGSSTAPRKS
jgi:hypothetical protein